MNELMKLINELMTFINELMELINELIPFNSIMNLKLFAEANGWKTKLR